MADQTLQEFLKGIADAIRQKRGISGYPINAQDFVSWIESIPIPESITLDELIENRTNADYLFYYYNASTFRIASPDVFKNVNSINYCFASSKLTTIPELNLTNVGAARQAFNNAYYLETLPVLNMPKCWDFSYTFYACDRLQKVKITGLERLVTDRTFYRCFDGCHTLETVDISLMTSQDNIERMCANCRSLKNLVIREVYSYSGNLPVYNETLRNCYHMTGTADETYNPGGHKDGRIYVPYPFVNQFKAASGWSDFADIITSESNYIEE